MWDSIVIYVTHVVAGRAGPGTGLPGSESRFPCLPVLSLWAWTLSLCASAFSSVCWHHTAPIPEVSVRINELP